MLGSSGLWYRTECQLETSALGKPEETIFSFI